VRIRHSDHRPLDQRRDFIKQVFGRHDGRADPRCLACQLLLDTAPPRRERRDYLTLVHHLLDICVGRMDHHIALAHESVPEGLGPRHQTERLHRHDLVTMHRHQPVRWPHELHRCTAVGELVAHHLGNRQSGDRLVERRLQPCMQVLPGGDAVQKDRLGLAVALDHQ
jgi:hypothetical protein